MVPTSPPTADAGCAARARSSWSARLSFLTLALATMLALLPAAAQAATVSISMDDGFDFSPKARSVSRGDTVRWENEASSLHHDVHSVLTGYADSGGIGGMAPGDAYQRTFPSAGKFPYLCRLHQFQGMKGSVSVPIAVRTLFGPKRFKVIVASTAASGRWRHVVQVRPPGASGWKTIATTTAASLVYRPKSKGTHDFRSAVKDSQSGKLSGFSPTVSRTY